MGYQGKLKMKLYSVTIHGTKFYFKAQISEEKCKRIDNICQIMQNKCLTDQPEDIFSSFVKMISKETNTSVIPIGIG